MTFFTKKFVGFFKKDFCAGSCTSGLWEGKTEVCQTSQITDGVGACDWLSAERAGSAVTVHLEPLCLK